MTARVTTMLHDPADRSNDAADVRHVAKLLSGTRVPRITPRSPLDALLATPAGVELLEVFLERLKHGVYM